MPTPLPPGSRVTIRFHNPSTLGPILARLDGTQAHVLASYPGGYQLRLPGDFSMPLVVREDEVQAVCQLCWDTGRIADAPCSLC